MPFLGPRLRDIFKFCVLCPGRIWWKGSQKELNVFSTFERRGKGKAGCGHITSTSLFAPASAPGELEMHRRNQKTWVPVLALPLTTYVTLGKLLNISGSEFHYKMLWGLSNMIYINVICSLPASIETIFIIKGLASSPLLKSSVLTYAFLKQLHMIYYLLFLPVPSLYWIYYSYPLHAS